MTTSRDTWFSKRPENHERTPRDLEAYVTARHRSDQHQMLLRAYSDSGMSGTELSRRTGKSAAVISRILSHPNNLTADTFCEVMFALTGMLPVYTDCYDPFGKVPAGRNRDHRPAWGDRPLAKSPPLDTPVTNQR